MESIVPEQLLGEQRAVEAEIRRAFAGVSREGGVSWSESAVIDNYGTDEEGAAAQARDREGGWEELIDDANWDEETGCGGFGFLDAIGFAYYLAPAMVRCVRRGSVFSDLVFNFDVGADSGGAGSRLERINRDQGEAIARFLRFMVAVCEADEEDVLGPDWREARDSWAAWARATHGLP